MIKVQIEKEKLKFFKNEYIEIEENVLNSKKYILEFPYNRPEFHLKKFVENKQKMMYNCEGSIFENHGIYELQTNKKYHKEIILFLKFFENKIFLKIENEKLQIKCNLNITQLVFIEYFLKIYGLKKNVGKFKKPLLKCNKKKMEQRMGTKITSDLFLKKKYMKLILEEKDDFFIQICNSRQDIVDYQDVLMELFEFKKTYDFKNLKFIQTIGGTISNKFEKIIKENLIKEKIKEKKNFTIDDIDYFENYSDFEEKKEILKIKNPIIKNLNSLRNKIFPSLLKNVEENVYEISEIQTKNQFKKKFAIKTNNFSILNNLLKKIYLFFEFKILKKKKILF